MDKQTTGTVVAATKQWWLKVNSKPVRGLGTSGAIYPYVIKVTYLVDGKEYTKRKWINAGQHIPQVGGNIEVMYSSDKPSKAKILW